LILLGLTIPTQNALVSDPGVKHTQVEEKIEDTAHVAKSLAAPRDLEQSVPTVSVVGF
jgi:hypothetical protein